MTTTTRTTRSGRRTLGILFLGILTSVLLIGIAGPASAHTGTTAEAAPDGRTLITYSFSHGCSGAPTIGLRAQLPAGASSVVVEDPAGWTSTTSSTEIHWTGPAIADGVSAKFKVAMVLAQPAGATVQLPNIQECAGGTELAWIGSPSSDTSESSRPAPTIVVPQNATAIPVTTGSVAPTTTIAPGDARMATQSNAITNEGSEQSEAGRFVFFGICAAILIGAGALFLKYRKKPSAG